MEGEVAPCIVLNVEKLIIMQQDARNHCFTCTLLLVLVLVLLFNHFIFVVETRKQFFVGKGVSNKSRLRRKMQSLCGYASTSCFVTVFFNL